MTRILITLSERRKPQNKSEATTINIASALGHSVEGHGPVICDLARLLIRENAADVLTDTVRVERGGRPVFEEAPLWQWAKLTVREAPKTRFAAYRERTAE